MDVGTVSNLKDFLVLIVYGGFGGVIAYKLCAILLTKKPDWDFLANRDASIVVAILVSCLGWYIGLWLSYFQWPPQTVRGWAEALFYVGFPIYVGSQVIHGVQKSKEVAAEKAEAKPVNG